MTDQTPIKQHKELNKLQQELYGRIADLLESYAKEHNLNNKKGVYQIFETLITLTVAMKALYVITKENKEEDKRQ